MQAPERRRRLVERDSVLGDAGFDAEARELVLTVEPSEEPAVDRRADCGSMRNTPSRAVSTIVISALIRVGIVVTNEPPHSRTSGSEVCTSSNRFQARTTR